MEINGKGEEAKEEERGENKWKKKATKWIKISGKEGEKEKTKKKKRMKISEKWKEKEMEGNEYEVES